MTPQHQPKEYIITEDDIETICMAFPKSFGKHLRSRPSPQTKKHFRYHDGQIVFSYPSLQEHNVAIRTEAVRQARTELLERAIKAIERQKIIDRSPSSLNLCIDILESLRQEPPAP